MRPIDADRLLTDRMKSMYYHLPNGDTAIPLIDIEHAPTIEPQRPHGEWSALEYGYKCSVCSAAFYTHSNFCQRCGADMREEGEQNE